MAVSITKSKAEEKLRFRNLLSKDIKENKYTLSFLVSALVTLVFTIIVTWCTFIIHNQSQLIEKQTKEIKEYKIYVSFVKGDMKLINHRISELENNERR